MKTPQLRRHALQFSLTLSRLSWIKGVAIILGAFGLLGWIWAVPALQAEVSNAKNTLAKIEAWTPSSSSSPAVNSQTQAEQRLAEFYGALGEKPHAEQQIKTLFALADKAGLKLNQAEYKSAHDKSGLYHTYQILMPVKGSYGAIRQFCEQSLVAIPFASLDELSFKREAIASRNTEAKLRITLYLSDMPRQPWEAP